MKNELDKDGKLGPLIQYQLYKDAEMTGNFECSVFKKQNCKENPPETLFSKKACGNFPTEEDNFTIFKQSLIDYLEISDV